MSTLAFLRRWNTDRYSRLCALKIAHNFSHTTVGTNVSHRFWSRNSLETFHHTQHKNAEQLTNKFANFQLDYLNKIKTHETEVHSNVRLVMCIYVHTVWCKFVQTEQKLCQLTGFMTTTGSLISVARNACTNNVDVFQISNSLLEYVRSGFVLIESNGIYHRTKLFP